VKLRAFELAEAKNGDLVEIFHWFNKLKHSTVNSKAFPEKSLYMLATIPAQTSQVVPELPLTYGW